MNMANSQGIKLYKVVENIGTEFAKVTSFIEPEITKIENEKLLSFINNDSRLERYRRELEEILKEKK